MSWFQDKSWCYRGGPRHKFEPRYSEADRNNHKVSGYITAEGMRRLTTLDIYIHDVCVFCGKIIYPRSFPPKEATHAKDPSDPVRALDPKDPPVAQNPSDSIAR